MSRDFALKRSPATQCGSSWTMAEQTLVRRDRLFMEAVALLYIMVAAHCNGLHYLFFPGLAALSYDALTRPWGSGRVSPRGWW